ncbi:hypothetical protein BHM03_00009824 [Ensete ventricosum]|nr:hypothetical protein BHM03_00009824 [Ensete ventricosum]
MPPFSDERSFVSVTRVKATESNHGEGMVKLLTDHLDDAESEADGRVSKGHDGRDDGQPPYLVEVGNLREEDLRHSEHNYVRVAVNLARAVVSVLVEAIRPFDRPVSNPNQTNVKHLLGKHPTQSSCCLYLHHANGGGDGVSYRDSDDVEVLEIATELDLEAVCRSPFSARDIHITRRRSIGGKIDPLLRCRDILRLARTASM